MEFQEFRQEMTRQAEAVAKSVQEQWSVLREKSAPMVKEVEKNLQSLFAEKGPLGKERLNSLQSEAMKVGTRLRNEAVRVAKIGADETRNFINTTGKEEFTRLQGHLQTLTSKLEEATRQFASRVNGGANDKTNDNSN